MSNQFQLKVAEKEEDFLKDLAGLIGIPSVQTNPKEKSHSLAYMLNLAKRDNLMTQSFSGQLGYIELGNGEETLVLFGHLDVSPCLKGWQTPPFELVEKEDRLYGCGVTSDKGPTLAAYYSMVLLKEMGLPIGKKIRLIVSTHKDLASPEQLATTKKWSIASKTSPNEWLSKKELLSQIEQFAKDIYQLVKK
ncbi:M20/M25/M40 family metallo-hydrolase [Vagococcus humatus]|nr:M20/M25/M40 family metallo-hydrolase [Vagococcus humatus]